MTFKIVAPAITLLIASVCAQAGSFIATCNAIVVGPAESVKSLVRFEWDGATLTTYDENLSDRLERKQDKVLLWRRIELEPSLPGEVLYSFLTSVHPTKSYKYYSALHFHPSATGGSLSVAFATADKDGFLISSTQIEYENCDFKAL